MILKDWSAAWKLYTETKPRLPKARSRSELFRKAWSYWRIWLLNVGLIVSGVFMVVGAWTESPAMAIGGFSSAILIGWLIRYARAKALATEFARCYGTYGLAQYPLLTWGRYIHYALFLEKLVEQKYSQEPSDIELAASFAKLLNLLKYIDQIHVYAASTPIERTRQTCGNHTPSVPLVVYLTNPRWTMGSDSPDLASTRGFVYKLSSHE